MGGCSAKTAEPDFGPFIDVWTADPPPKRGAPVDYLILQGDFSVCQFTVRGPKDADYSGGEYTITPKLLTLTFARKEGEKRTQVYAITSYRRGELHLTDVSPGGGKPVVLKHTRDYSSCADAQTLFGLQLKVR